MPDAQTLHTMELYNSIRSLSNFLKTDVKISNVVIDCVLGESDTKTSNVPGFTIEVEISNAAPVEASYPLIVFLGVGLRVKFPETIHEPLTQLHNESNFAVDVTNSPQSNPFPGKQAKRTDRQDFPPVTADEKKLGHVLFPGRSIKYKFRFMDAECPDVEEIKLWAEGSISSRHLFHLVNEIPITSDNIIYQL